jgi:autotransporter-associated beta strand protein
MKVGAGTQVLSGTNVSAGSIYGVNGGTLQFAKTVALHNDAQANWTASKVIAGSGGTLAFNVGGTGEFTSGNVTTLLTNLGGLGGAVASGQGLQAGSAIGFDTTNATGGTFTVADNIADSTGTGGGALGLTKLGTETLMLTGTSTYTGPTSVVGGTLAVNGSLGNTAVTVGSGATLQGNGTIGGPVTIQGGGTMATGNSIESLASGTLTLNALSIFEYEMNSDALPSEAGDLTAVTGDLVLSLGNDAILTLVELGSGIWANDAKLTLVSYTGTWNGGLFDYLGNPLGNGDTINFSGTDWVFRYDDTEHGTNYIGDLTGSTFVTMTAVPQPGIMSLVGVVVWLWRSSAFGFAADER